jgi:hypothetical protein
VDLGVRFDTLNGNVPAQTRPGGIFLPELSFDEVTNVPNWKDVSPRLGVAYDLFGSGRTAIKGQIGRYVIGEGVTYADNNSPANKLAALADRTWNDRTTFPAGDPRNGNYVPDCDLRNPAQNGECGALDVRNFGRPIFTQTYDSQLLEGWHVRPYQWQGSAGVQHELLPGVGLSAMYFRTWRGNLTVNDNTLIAPENFDEFCVTAPTDTRLGSASGQRVCGFYDLKPEFLGQTNNLVTHANNFGRRTHVYNGVDVGVTARFLKSGLFTGGVSHGQTNVDACDNVFDSPSPAVGTILTSQLYCQTHDGDTQVKLAASVPLVWGIQAAATYQNLTAPPITAGFNVPNSLLAPQLGRNLAVCGVQPTCNAQVTVDLLEPSALREDRATQLDIRLSKVFQAGRVRFLGRFDVYNVTNADDVTSFNGTYGSTWLTPRTTIPGRLYKFGGSIDF